MDALQFNKAVSQHCKESGGDCCKCDLRLYCYLSPSERPDELVSLVIDFLHNHIENHVIIPITARLHFRVLMIWT